MGWNCSVRPALALNLIIFSLQTKATHSITGWSEVIQGAALKWHFEASLKNEHHAGVGRYCRSSRVDTIPINGTLAKHLTSVHLSVIVPLRHPLSCPIQCCPTPFSPVGRSGWGIAWYLNSTLIPVINVTRGNTYTFLIYGGNNSSNPSNYHPFYITDSIAGGRTANTPEEVGSVTLYHVVQWTGIQSSLCSNHY